MKLFNRVLSLLLIVAMLVATVPVFAAGSAQIVVGDAWPEYADGAPEALSAVDVSSGDQVIAIPVSIKNNPGVAGIIMNLILPEGWKATEEYASEEANFWHSYDKDNYSILAVSGRTGISLKPNYQLIVNAEAKRVVIGVPQNLTDDGALFYAFVTVPKGAANGENTVAVNIERVENDAGGIITDSFTSVSNTITVTGGVDKLTDSNTTIENLNAQYVYTGSAIEPALIVKYNGKTLTKGTDYTVSYENNTNVGEATVTVTGTGAYKGYVTRTFQITKKTGTISMRPGTAAAYTKSYGDVDFPLDVIVNSGAKLTYTSNNENVVTVDAAGKVTVVGAGSAEITVSAPETENYTKPADFKVAVTVGKANQALNVQNPGAKTYGDAEFTLNVTGNQGALSFASSKPTVADVDPATGKVTIKGVGTATITVTAAEVAGKYNVASKDVTVTVAQKEVTISGITAANKVYNKTTAATVDKSAATIGGKVAGDDLDFTVTGVFADATAGNGKTVNLTVALTGAAAANYKLSAASQKTATANIEKATVAAPVAKTGLTYNTTEQTGVEATADYTVTGGKATNADDYVATATLVDSVNYKWADASFNGTVAWSIAKADADDLTMAKTARYSTTTAQTITAAEIAQLMDLPGNVTIGTCTFSGDDILATKTGTADTITYALVGGLQDTDAGKVAVIKTTISSDNYNDVELTITVTVQDKIDVSAGITFADGEAFYTGKSQKHETAKYNGSADGITYTYSADPINVDTYKVTAIYEDADNYGTKTVNFRVKAVPVTVIGGTVAAKQYDATTDAALSKVEFAGLVNGESFTTADYTVTSASYADANVGNGKQVTFAVKLATTGTAANYVLTGTVPAINGDITPKQIAVTLDAIADQTFTGNAIVPTVKVNSTETLNSYVLAEGVDYTVSYTANTNVGTATAKVTAKAGSNYTFTTATTNFEILEAAAPTIAGVNAEYTYNFSGNGTLDIAGIPANAGTVTYEVGTATGETSMVSGITVANGKISVTVASGDMSLVGKTVTIPVTIKMQNYGDVTINVVITRTEKDMPVLSVQPIEKVYDGVELKASDIRGTATFQGQILYGSWNWVTSPATLVNANETGYTARVKFTPDLIDTYAEVEADVTVTIRKANPVGQPSYTPITEENKTLADAKLSIGTITPAGTIAWTLPATTKAEAGVAYQWTFIPTDTVNYNTLTGTLTPYVSGGWGWLLPILGAASGSIGRFNDVSSNAWYADAVNMVVSRGLFEGVSKTEFNPNGTMTRAMLVTVLWRLAGEPAPRTNAAFSDVPAYQWYTNAVAWANENGIVTGITANTFAPKQNVTREQMTAILYRFARTMGLDRGVRANLSEYKDVYAVSSYAKDAMSWAVAEGLISGMTETTLAPKGSATRAQVATIIMRFVKNFR